MKPSDVGLPNKLCPYCDTVKPIEQFGAFRKHCWGPRPRCLKCHAAHMREYKQGFSPEKKREYREKETARRAGLRGLTLEQYRKMQRSPCQICGRLLSKAQTVKGHGMHVDHCHKSGKARGTLCTLCNKGIGVFKDNPILLRAAARYLEKYK